MLRSGVAFNTKRCAFLSGSQDLEMTRSFPGSDRPAELPPSGTVMAWCSVNTIRTVRAKRDRRGEEQQRLPSDQSRSWDGFRDGPLGDVRQAAVLAL
jgi:hypothetical protein